MWGGVIRFPLPGWVGSLPGRGFPPLAGLPARELLCKMARRALSPHSPVRRPHKIKQNKGINLQCAHPRALRPACGIGASALAPAFGYLARSLAGPRRLGGLASQWLARAPKQT